MADDELSANVKVKLQLDEESLRIMASKIARQVNAAVNGAPLRAAGGGRKKAESAGGGFGAFGKAIGAALAGPGALATAIGVAVGNELGDPLKDIAEGLKPITMLLGVIAKVAGLFLLPMAVAATTFLRPMLFVLVKLLNIWLKLTNNPAVKAVTEGPGKIIGQGASLVGAGLDELTGKKGALGAELQKQMEQSQKEGEEARTAIGNFYQGIADTFGVKQFNWEDAKAKIKGFYDGIALGLQDLRDKAGPFIEAAKEKASTAFADISDKLKAAGKAGGDWLKTNVTDKLDDLFKDLPTNFLGIADGVKDWLKTNITDKLGNAFDSLKTGVQDFVNGLINAINKLFGILRGLGTSGTFLGMPYSFYPFSGLQDINPVALAEGGIVTKPTMAVVGEKGPEAVVPLNRGRMGVGGETHIHFHGDVYGDDGIREFERKMSRLQKQLIAGRVSYGSGV